MAKRRGKSANGATAVADQPAEPGFQFTLRQLADMYEAALNLRIAAEGRRRSKSQGHDDTEQPAEVVSSPIIDRLQEVCQLVVEQMGSILPVHPVYGWAAGVPGLNDCTMGRLLGLIPMYEEKDFTSFAKLRVFAGLCPGRNRRKKGEKSPFCGRLRTQLWVVFSSMLKVESKVANRPYAPKRFYGEIYRKWRVIYAERHGVGESGAEWLYEHGFWNPDNDPDLFKLHGEGWCWQKRLNCPVCQAADWRNVGDWNCTKDGCTGAGFTVAPEHPLMLGDKVGCWKFTIIDKTPYDALEWPDNRQHRASFYKVGDVFLSHIWLLWRLGKGWKCEGFGTHDPNGHHTTYNYADFSSVAYAERKS